jgi:glycerate-2-kinase
MEMSRQSAQKLSLLEKAEKIYRAALAGVEPASLVKKKVSVRGKKLVVQGRSFDLASFDRIFLVAIGKAAPFMAKSLAELLGSRVKEGIALVLPQIKINLKKIACLPASHPLPDEKSVAAAQRILALAEKVRERDFLFVLISGGGSAQLCLPLEGVSLAEKRAVTDMLLKSGSSIVELNTVRKHLSRIKGGRLAQAAFPGTVINLVISDVIHNDLESIASGPSYWDSSTYKDAFQILRKYRLWNIVPFSVREAIGKGMKKEIGETLKKENSVFGRVHSFIIGDNFEALKAAREEAQKLGFKTSILTSADYGEAKDAARSYAALVVSRIQSKKADTRPLCLLSGGELTVTVKGKGKGGRNQEFVLAVAEEMRGRLQGISSWLILSLGSDGIDGPTDAAGAWAGPLTLKRAASSGLDLRKFLARNDSYSFFKEVGGLIITGPTQTNVMDIRLFMVDA